MAESARHKKLKREVSSFFASRGWETEEEARGQGWRADCLVEKDGRRAALEIELARTSVSVIKERAEKYQRAGIASIWLVDKKSRFPKREDMPIFPIENDKGSEIVFLDDYDRVSLDIFLGALEEGRLHYRAPLLDKERAGALLLFGETCYKCQKKISVWQGLEIVRCVCGDEFECISEMRDAVFERELREIWDPLHGPWGDVAYYKKRATSVRKIPYFVAHCPHCNAVQGNWYLQMGASGALYGRVPAEVHYLSDSQIGREKTFGDSFTKKHWCLEQ